MSLADLAIRLPLSSHARKQAVASRSGRYSRQGLDMVSPEKVVELDAADLTELDDDVVMELSEADLFDVEVMQTNARATGRRSMSMPPAPRASRPPRLPAIYA